MSKFGNVHKRGEELVKKDESIPLHKQPLYRSLKALEGGKLRICYEADRLMLKELDAISSQLADTHDTKKIPRKRLMDYAIQYAIKNKVFFQGGKWWE